MKNVVVAPVLSDSEKSRMDVKDIAKAVREGIKANQKAGSLPKAAKFSVKVSRYSGGQSLNVRVVESPVQMQSFAWSLFVAEESHYPNGFRAGEERVERDSVEGARILGLVSEIVDAYNYNNSRSEVDYFDVNFYGDVSVSHELRAAEEKKVIEVLASLPKVVDVDGQQHDALSARRLRREYLAFAVDAMDLEERAANLVSVSDPDAVLALVGSLLSKDPVALAAFAARYAA